MMALTPFTRADHDKSALRYSSDMTDKEFARISPLLPAQPRRGRKRRTDLASVIDAIFYVLQSGCAWANLPKDFPPRARSTAPSGAFSKSGALNVDYPGLCEVARLIVDTRNACARAGIVSDTVVKA